MTIIDTPEKAFPCIFSACVMRSKPRAARLANQADVHESAAFARSRALRGNAICAQNAEACPAQREAGF
jgi:hypothetical protein